MAYYMVLSYIDTVKVILGDSYDKKIVKLKNNKRQPHLNQKYWVSLLSAHSAMVTLSAPRGQLDQGREV